jgi:predicted nucleic acid-binding protein
MDYVLIDSDVILDFFFDREPFADYASEVFTLCENGTIKGFTTPVIISNVYYLLSKIAKHEVVIEKLKQLLSIIDIIEINKEVIIEALNSKFKDFEDALQNYAAENSKQVKIILSSNTKDYQKSKLAVFSPEIYLKNKTNY